MMGTQSSERSLFSYSVNLDKRVRADNPLRRFAAVLDLDWVRQEVAGCYGKKGNISVDPVVLVKMMLLLFLDNVPSERELMEVIAERMDYLWFLGYGLDDEIPNHSVLSKARARWGKELFEQIFTRTVLQCIRAGLVGNERLHLDSSVIKASASKDSVIQAPPELVNAIRAAYREQESKLEEPDSKSVNAMHVSTTDPDATLGRGGGDPRTQLCYKNHRAVDDTQGVITAVKTTTGQAGDAQQVPDLLAKHEQHTGTWPNIAVGDQHYGSAENYRYCQSHGITTHLKPCKSGMDTQKVFGPERFEYDESQDRYKCPAGYFLRYHNVRKEEKTTECRIEKAEYCQGCSLKNSCTRSRIGRTLTRPLFSELVFAGRAQARSPEAQKSYQRRKCRIEGSFADATNNHGFKRARWRGLWKVQIQDWLIAAVQNLRILMKQQGNWGAGAQIQARQLIARPVHFGLVLVISSQGHSSKALDTKGSNKPGYMILILESHTAIGRFLEKDPFEQHAHSSSPTKARSTEFTCGGICSVIGF